MPAWQWLTVNWFQLLVALAALLGGLKVVFTALLLIPGLPPNVRGFFQAVGLDLQKALDALNGAIPPAPPGKTKRALGTPWTPILPLLWVLRTLMLVTFVLFALVATGCGATLQQIASADVVISAGVVAGLQALWPSIYSLIPAAQQAQATADYNVALLTLTTQAAVVQDGISALSTADLEQQLLLLDDAITKIVALVNAYKNLSNSPAYAKAFAQLSAHADQAHAKVQGIRAKLAAGAPRAEVRRDIRELDALLTQGMSR